MHPVAVLAGGRGTRMAQRTGPLLPKALLPVAGAPFIDFKLRQLAEQGAGRVVLLTGHGADLLAGHVGNGRRWGLDVDYVADGDALLGTGGAVRRAREALGEVFWVTFADTLVSVPVGEVEALLSDAPYEGVMTVLENRDAWDRSNVAVQGGLVVDYRKGAPPGTFSLIDYGMSLFRAGAFDPFPAGAAFDLGAVVQALVARRALAAFMVQERFYEIGSDAGHAATEAHLRGGDAD